MHIAGFIASPAPQMATNSGTGSVSDVNSGSSSSIGASCLMQQQQQQQQTSGLWTRLIYHLFLTSYYCIDVTCVCIAMHGYGLLAQYMRYLYVVAMKAPVDAVAIISTSATGGAGAGARAGVSTDNTAVSSQSLSSTASVVPAPAPAPHTSLTYWLRVVSCLTVIALCVLVVYSLHHDAAVTAYVHHEQQQQVKRGQMRSYAYTVLLSYASTLFVDSSVIATFSFVVLGGLFGLYMFYILFHMASVIGVYVSVSVSYRLRYGYLHR